MENKDYLGLNIIVREEEEDNKRVFIVNNDDLGVADFGDTLDEAIENFRKSVKLYLEAYPEKKELLMKERQPLLVSRISL